MVRVRDAALLGGSLDGFSGVFPDGRHNLAVRIDFLAGGVVPVSGSDPLDALAEAADLLTVYVLDMPGIFVLTTPDGSTLTPHSLTPGNPTAYPRHQIRGVVLNFEVTGSPSGRYQLTYTYENESAVVDLVVP
jgi:hypothetical protein